jgi:hypothetical protein
MQVQPQPAPQAGPIIKRPSRWSALGLPVAAAAVLVLGFGIFHDQWIKESPPENSPAGVAQKGDRKQPATTDPQKPVISITSDFGADLKAGKSFPEGWTGPAYLMRHDEGGRPCLRPRDPEPNPPFVTLPRTSLKGDFRIEADVRLHDIVSHTFKIRLGAAGGKEFVEVVVRFNGQITFGNDPPQWAANFSRGSDTHLVLQRKGKTIQVIVGEKDKENVIVNSPRQEVIEYDTVNLGIIGKGNHTATLYKVSVESLAP